MKRARPTLLFLGSFALLDSMLNMQYPGPEPAYWYLIPSIDVVLLFGYFALFGLNGWRVPAAVRWVLVVLLFLVRLVRIGDGLETYYFSQTFNLYTDLPLVPEMVRFAHSTLPLWQFTLGTIALVLATGVLAVLCYHALGCAERYLTTPRRVSGFAGICLVFLGLSLVPHDPHFSQLYLGGFATSAIPRLRHEGQFLLNVYGYKSKNLEEISDTQRRLERTPHNLSKLEHANVLLFFVESYGETVFDRPLFANTVRGAYRDFEHALEGHGYSMVSSRLASSTYGGRSWLAHTTFATGVHVGNQLQYELIATQHPKPIARFFRDAGYRTVLVQPGTTRAWPKGEFFQFENKYYLANFDYVGPTYGWATMPDQYVIDFIHRHEVAVHPPPLFINYVLVSSHAPWSDLPAMVDDWSKLGDGAIFRKLPGRHYPIEWPNFSNASEAYIQSILYDLELLKRYLCRLVEGGALVIVLGDHQPVYEVNGQSESHGVPIHIISRNTALLEPFRARGYTAGMWPGPVDEEKALESFLPDFLADFSTP